MTTEISDASRELAAQIQIIGHHEATEEVKASFIQTALTAARNNALEDAAIMADATGYEKVAKAIRSMKVTP